MTSLQQFHNQFFFTEKLQRFENPARKFQFMVMPMFFFLKRINKKTGQDTGEEVTMVDIYQEFDQVANNYKIMKYTLIIVNIT